MHQDRPRPLAGRTRTLLSALALLMTCFLSLAPAQAQTFSIFATNPANLQGGEQISPTFTVRLAGGTSGTVYETTVTVANGTARYGFDFDGPRVAADGNTVPRGTTFNLRVTSNGGNVDTAVVVPVYDDESFEANENFTFSVSNGPNAADSRTYTILDNDAQPRVRIRDLALALAENTDEGRYLESQPAATFRVELVGANTGNRGFFNNQGALRTVTSVQNITFNTDIVNANGTDPTSSTQAESQFAPGLAQAGTEVTRVSQQSTIAASDGINANNSALDLPFTVTDDNIDENNEAFLFRIVNPINTSNPGITTGFGVILDDDAPDVTVSSPTVTEADLGDNTVRATFTVSLSRPSVQPIYIDYFTANGSANDAPTLTNGVADYQGVFLNDSFTTTQPDTGTLFFAPNQTSQTVSIIVNGDNVSEGNTSNGLETFFLVVRPNEGLTYTASPTDLSIFDTRQQAENDNSLITVPETVQRGLTFTNSFGTASIIDNDTTQVSINDVSVVEGNNSLLNFTIRLTVPSQNAISITAQTQQGTATSGVDYNPVNTTVTIPAGATSVQFQVPVIPDTIDEEDETLFVNLSLPGGTLGVEIQDPQGVGTIIDDDGPIITVEPVTANEGVVGGNPATVPGTTSTTPFRFRVRLVPVSPQTLPSSPQAITFNYQTTDGTATSGGVNADFVGVPAPQTITIPANTNTDNTEIFITVNVNGDEIFEPTETFNLLLSSAVNATLASSTVVGTITNDDGAPQISVNDVRVVEGSAAVFTISLSNPSQANNTVSFATSNGTAIEPGDYTAVNSTIVFNGATANTLPQRTRTVSVQTNDDTVIEGNETFNLNITNTASATLGVAKAQGVATIVDNDVPRASIDSVSVNESAAGATGTVDAVFTVTLRDANGQIFTAVQPVTFNVVAASGTATLGNDFTAPPATLTIPTGSSTGTITVPVRGDLIAEGPETFTVTISPAPVTGAAPGEPAPVEITAGTGTGTIIDDDVAGITVTPTAGLVTTEAGGTATFTVALTSQPTSNVTITLASSNTAEGTVSPSTLTFTAQNFATPQTVTVRGVDDNLSDGNIAYNVSVTAQSSDANYAGRVAGPVSVVNNDNDDPRLTLSSNAVVFTEGGTTTATVSRNTANNSAALVVALSVANVPASNAINITVPPTVTIPAGQASVNFTVTAPDNSSIDGTRTANVTATATGFADPSNALGFQVQDNDSASVTVSKTTLATSEAGTTDSFTVRLNSSPTANVTITFTSGNTAEATVAPASVTFTPANFNAPQTVSVTGVNDFVADGPQTVIIRGAIASSDANYAGATVPNVTVVNADDDTAGFLVTPTSGLTTDEAGRTATFTVAPSTAPRAAVTVSVSSSNAAEGTVSPSTLTFPSGSRDPQTVTVTGVDDRVADGNVAYQVILGAAVSQDSVYSGLVPAPVSVTNLDNDAVAVVVSTRALTTTEAGGTDAFTVALTSQPTSNVTITALSTDTTEGVVEPSTITFTPSNFATAQRVLVRGQNDDLVDGNVGYKIRLSIASSDPAYARQRLPEIDATNIDNDVARIVVTVPAAGIRVNESGTSATFRVALVGQPAANVVIPLTVDNPREARLSTSGLNFTPQNYATPQTVTVTGLDDLVADGNQPFTINLGPTRSNDPAFNGLRPAAVRGVNYDNDRAGVTLAPTTLTLREGARSSIRITLNSQPTAPVTISLLSSDTSEITVPASIVLNASNYRAGIAVPITAVADGVVDGNQLATVRITSMVSADRLYNVPRSAVTGARITVQDADVPSIRLSTSALRLNENGGSAVVQVALGARPVSALRVLVVSSNPAVGVVGPTSLIFTPENFNRGQQVTVRAIDNSTAQSTPATFNVAATALSPGTPYNGVSGTVSVTVIDDEDAVRPTVTLDSPANGGTFQAVSAITGTATDNRAVSRLNVEVARLGANNAPVAYLQSSGAFAATPATRVVPVSASGTFALALPSLTVARYRVTAVALDANGNSGQATSTFTITDAPTTIAITSPTTGGAVNPTSVVRGVVSTRSSLTALTVVLRRNITDVKKFNVTRTGTAANSTFVTDQVGRLAAGTYTIVATATDAQGNTVTASSTVLVDVTPPTAVAITTPRNNQVVDNLFEVRGTVADNANGSGIDSVELVIRRRSVDGFFNGRTFQSAFTTVRATVTGNTWVYSLPSGLPADPDPLNALYSLQAIATDRAGNGVRSAGINVVFSSNGSSGDGSTGTPIEPGSSVVTAQAPTSPFKLSTSAANASQVVLNFTGPLNVAQASDVASYEVSINGQLVKVEGARASGSTAAVLLPEGEAGAGDVVSIAYDLRDSQGRLLRGKANVTVR